MINRVRGHTLSHSNAQSRFRFIVWASELGSLHFDQIEHMISSRTFWQRNSQRCNDSHCYNGGKSDKPVNQVMSAAFWHKPFSCIAFTVLQTMAQMMTEAECIGKMWINPLQNDWHQVCILSDLVTLDQLRNHDFENTQCKSDFPAGMLHQMDAEGNLLQIESRCKSCETETFVRQLVQPTTSCRKCTKQNTCSQIHTTRKEQIKLMENKFNSYSRYFLVPRRTRSSSESMNGSDKVGGRWTAVYSRNLPSPSYFHGDDERNSEFLASTERR